MKIRINKFLLAVFLISLLIRVGYVLTLPQEIKYDEIDYDNLANNISSGLGYINTERDLFAGHRAARPPGYPLFLTTIYLIFGRSLTAVRLVQAVVSSLMVTLIYFLSKEFFKEKVARIAASIAVIYPFFIYYTGEMQSELLCSFYLLLTVYYSSRLLKDPSFKNIALTGFLIGLTGLTRPIFVLYGAFLFLGLLACQRLRLRRKIKAGLLTAAVIVLTYSPWIIRNYVVLGSFIPGMTTAGSVLYISVHPSAEGSLVLNYYDPEFLRVRRTITDELQRDRYYYRQAMRLIINNPGRQASLFGPRFIKLWNVLPNVALGQKLLSLASFGTLLPFFLIGFIKSARENKAIMPVMTVFYLTLVCTALFYGSTRLRFPIEPLILIFAAAGIVSVWSRFGYRSDPAMRKLYHGQGIHSLFFHYRWWVVDYRTIESYLPKQGLIYDLGAGHGIFANYLVLESPQRRVIGIEHNRERLASAQATVKGRDNPAFYYGDIGRAELKRCDALVLLDLLHHCPGYKFQEDLIRRCYERLKGGGRLVILEEHNRPLIKHLFTAPFDYLLSPRQGIYYRYKDDMRRLLEDAGFKVEIKPLDARIPHPSVLYIAERP